MPRSRIEAHELVVASLGAAQHVSPLGLSNTSGDEIPDWVDDDEGVLCEVECSRSEPHGRGESFEKAGPRQRIFFDPAHTTAAIVTCGGLCPGINNVIRSLVLELHHKYRVQRVLGIRYGYAGLDPSCELAPVELGPDEVLQIHRHGGSELGMSRGAPDVAAMADELVRHGIDILFTIGGDGTQRGAHALAVEIARRGLPIAIVGVPKTIDNDIPFVDKTFGYDTAVEVARQAVDAAHTEAESTRNGIGLVKLMGRDAGFIAAAATLASRDVNFCLIPEVRFELDGPAGLLAALEARLAKRGHALIVAAEGCASALVTADSKRDASGNVDYQSVDFGSMLKEAIVSHFERVGTSVSLKYIDPSYMIRGGAANAHDSIFCDALARNAVHAGMAGKTDMLIGRVHRLFTHVPLALLGREQKRIDPDGPTWLSVTEATGQPRLHR